MNFFLKIHVPKIHQYMYYTLGFPLIFFFYRIQMLLLFYTGKIFVYVLYWIVILNEGIDCLILPMPTCMIS